MHVGTKNFSIFVEKENDSTIRALLRKESHASFSRLSPTQGERTEVRGSRLQPHAPESTLTRPLSLAKGQATRPADSIVKLDAFPVCRRTKG